MELILIHREEQEDYLVLDKATKLGSLYKTDHQGWGYLLGFFRFGVRYFWPAVPICTRPWRRHWTGYPWRSGTQGRKVNYTNRQWRTSPEEFT